MYVDHRDQPSKGYFAALMANLVIGCWSGGFALSGNTDVVDILAVQLEWGDQVNKYNTILSTCAVLGMMLGAMFSKTILVYGRRKIILICNIVLVVLTVPYFFSSNYAVLCITRTVLGFVAAVIINASATVIGESVPVEYQSVIGTSINTGIVSGIFITVTFGLLLPDKDDTQACMDDKIWRVSYSLQLVPAVITSAMWLLMFKNEPMRFLIAKAEADGIGSAAHKKACQVLRENYGAVGEQREMEVYAEVSKAISSGGGGSQSPGYIGALTNPMYRRATIVCIVFAISVQLTGINAINIYSTTIYQQILDESGGKGIQPRVGSVLNLVAQMIACGLSPLGSFLKFRMIINGGLIVMALFMGLVAIFSYEEMNTLLVVMMMCFLALFQFTLGTYSWVYVSQVTCQEGLSMATSILWVSVFVLSLVTNSMFENLKPYGTFTFFAMSCLISAIILHFFLRETKGLSPEQAALVYAKQGVVEPLLDSQKNKSEQMQGVKIGRQQQHSYSLGGVTNDSEQSNLVKQ